MAVTDAFHAAGAAGDGGGDADDFAADVQQGPAAVAEVDAGVGLDEVAVVALVEGAEQAGHGTAQGADDAEGHGRLALGGHAEGVAHDHAEVSLADGGHVADAGLGQAGGVDAEDGQVAAVIAGDGPDGEGVALASVQMMSRGRLRR